MSVAAVQSCSPAPYGSLQETLDILAETLERHVGWQDPSSLQLFECGCDILEGRAVSERIGQLTVLLRNPANGRLFDAPWLVGCRVWEEKSLARYLSSHGGDEPVLEGAKVHRFVLSMTRLMSRLPQGVTTEAVQHLLSRNSFAERVQNWRALKELQALSVRAAPTARAASESDSCSMSYTMAYQSGFFAYSVDS